jgi:hypothetical protein
VIAKATDTNRPSDARNQAGLDAERKMAFYLRRTFEHDRDVWVFNDLRLVKNRDAAQIDHLVLHRSGMVLIESKSATGEIAVTRRGEWSRRTAGWEQGMESPVVHPRLQAKFLRLMLLENRGHLLDGQLGGLLLTPVEVGRLVAFLLKSHRPLPGTSPVAAPPSQLTA